MSYIGQRKIKEVKETEDKTPGGTPIMEVSYEDGKKESLSKLMCKEIVSDKPCDLSELRDKRVRPIVAHTLAIFREWGLRMSELSYASTLLNASLENSQRQALLELWKPFQPTIQEYDEVDLIAMDKVLKQIKNEKSESILSPYKPETDNGKNQKQ